MKRSVAVYAYKYAVPARGHKVGRGNLEQNLCSRNCREEGNRWTSEIMLTQ